MIEISGSVHKRFIFPAGVEQAIAYYADFDRTLNYLSHISILRRYASGQYRLLFETVELGVYHVRIFCDIQTQSDTADQLIRVKPLLVENPVSLEAGQYALSGQGAFESESHFRADGRQTMIEYHLALTAALPEPLSLRFMPQRLVTRIAQNVTDWRFEETVEGFIERSIFIYQQEKSYDQK